MSQLNTLPSSQHNYADALAGELYPDPFTPNTSPFADTPTFFTGAYPALPGDNLAPTTPQRQATTDQLTSLTGPLADIHTTQSLIAALQSTMTTTSRQPVVIPGKKRKQSARHLSMPLRMGIVITSLLGVLLISLLSLTPLGQGQSGIPLINTIVNIVNTAQQDITLNAGHTLGAKQNANTAPAPAAALPPMALPKSQYIAIAQQDATAVGINPTYFVRQINQESGFNPNAVSPAGAVGIAQFLPSTAAGLGFNPYDPIAALKGAAKYMANLSNQYGGDYAKALAAYNAGPGTVASAVNRGGANWMNFLPLETRNYIHTIMGI